MINLKKTFKIFFTCAFLVTINNGARGNSLIEVTKESYLAENPSQERQVIVDFIVNQFDNKQEKGVSQKDLDLIWKKEDLKQNLSMLRFQIINQQLYTDSYKFDNDHYYKHLKEYFIYLTKKYKINDVDFIIHSKDVINSYEVSENLAYFPPTFMMSKNTQNKHEQDKLLMPDAHMISKDRNWVGLSKDIDEASNNISWQQKADKIFWRGGATGSKNIYRYNISNFDKLPRLKLVMFSKLYPDLIDAEITAYYEFSSDQDGDNLKKVLNTLFNNGEKRVNEIDHLKYKYLIAVDGNTCPWLRVPWIMLSNSVLVKQETEYIEWFYPALKAYTHYVPVQEDLTDIFSQLDWMRSNDEKVKEISINAQRFVKNNLMPEDIEKQMVIVLNRYSQIQKNDKLKITLPRAD